MPIMQRVLVIRLSAIGDVSMVIPILYAVCKSNPQYRFTLLTQPFLVELLIDAPSNLEAMVMSIKDSEKNTWGVLNFAYRLRKERFDYIIDLHDVLRSKILRWIAGTMTKAKVFKLDKHRKERQLLLQKKSTVGNTLPSMPQIYQETFEKAQFKLLKEEIRPIYNKKQLNTHLTYFIENNIKGFNSNPLIGIAPFASKRSKEFNLNIIVKIIRQLLEQTTANIILFSGKNEKKQSVEKIQSLCLERIIITAGKLNLQEEIILISHLHCMISMDSANMHFASMVGVPVVSLWAGTSPKAGFLGLFQKQENAITNNTVDCSPCSIFGTNNCSRKDFACCEDLDINDIVNNVIIHIKEKNK